ncbi:MAG: phage tail tape measure protein [Phycisphaerae bacterium]|jgi:TP901 family phage tail tape measure protein
MAKQGRVAGRARVVVGLDNELPKGLKTALKDMKTFAAAMQSIGTGMAATGAVITAPAFLSAKNFAAFSDEMAVVRVLTKTAGLEFDQLTDKAAAIASASGFSAIEVGASMKELARTGFSANQVLAIIPATMDLIRAGAVDAAMGTTYMSDAIRTFQLNASDASHVADIMVVAANSASMNVEMLADSLKHTGASADLSGQKIEKISAAIAILSNRGLKGELAGTSLNQALVHMVSPETEAGLHAIGVEVKDDSENMRDLMDIVNDLGKAMQGMGGAEKLSLLHDLFDVRGMRSMAILTQSFGEWKSLAETLRTAEGAAKEVADAMQNTLGGSFRSMMADVYNLENAVGEALTPTLRPLMQAIGDAAISITGFVRENETLITIVGGLGGALSIGGVAFIALGTAGKLASAAILDSAKAWYKLIGAQNASTASTALATNAIRTHTTAIVQSSAAVETSAAALTTEGITKKQIIAWEKALIAARLESTAATNLGTIASQEAAVAAMAHGQAVASYSVLARRGILDTNTALQSPAWDKALAASRAYGDVTDATAARVGALGLVQNSATFSVTRGAVATGGATIATTAYGAASSAAAIAVTALASATAFLISSALPIVIIGTIIGTVLHKITEWIGLNKWLLRQFDELRGRGPSTYDEIYKSLDRLKEQYDAGIISVREYTKAMKEQWEVIAKSKNPLIPTPGSSENQARKAKETAEEEKKAREEEEKNAKAATKLREEKERLLELEDRINEIRIEGKPDSAEKEIELVELKYAKELRAAAEKRKANEKETDEEKKLYKALELEKNNIWQKYYDKRSEDGEQINEDLAQRIRDTNISMITDEFDRRRAELTAYYDDLKKANKDSLYEAALLEYAKNKDLEKINQDEAKVQTEANQDWENEIEEKNLELNYEGYELDKKRLELAHKIALARAEAAGLDTEALEKLQGLQMQVLDLNNRPSNDLSSMGTFSSMNVSQMLGMGGGTFDRIAKATEQTAKNTAKPGSVPAWQ